MGNIRGFGTSLRSIRRVIERHKGHPNARQRRFMKHRQAKEEEQEKHEAQVRDMRRHAGNIGRITAKQQGVVQRVMSRMSRFLRKAIG